MSTDRQDTAWSLFFDDAYQRTLFYPIIAAVANVVVDGIHCPPDTTSRNIRAEFAERPFDRASLLGDD